MGDQIPVRSEQHMPACVLLVEDDAILTINAKMMLAEMGVAEVHSAGSVKAALALIDQIDFDCGMLDFLLSDENCLPVAQRLCAVGIPVLITTGLLDIELPDDCKTAQILGKPYSFLDLKKRIGRLTSGDQIRPST